MPLFKQEGYNLMGAAFEVYNEMGSGFLEEVYQECMEMELEMRKVPFVAQAELGLTYKDRPLKKRYKPDLVAYGGVVAELKAVKQLTKTETSQLVNYMKSSKTEVGYLINFGNPERLEWQRFILSEIL
jgi:GxxExxY protein